MKTKTKPRARRMWANWYPEVVICRPSRADGRAASDRSYPHGVRVLVIPLDDVPALIRKATAGYIKGGYLGGVHGLLTAIGVLPKQRKGGAK